MMDRIDRLQREVDELRRELAQRWLGPPLPNPDFNSQHRLEVTQVEHGWVIGDVLRQPELAGTWFKPTTATITTPGVLGVVIEVVSPDVVVIATGGVIEGLDSLAKGSVYYLDAATAGAVTTIETGVPVYVATSTTTAHMVDRAGGASGPSIPALVSSDTQLTVTGAGEGKTADIHWSASGSNNSATLGASYISAMLSGWCRVVMNAADFTVTGPSSALVVDNSDPGDTANSDQRNKSSTTLVDDTQPYNNWITLATINQPRLGTGYSITVRIRIQNATDDSWEIDVVDTGSLTTLSGWGTEVAAAAYDY